jgi:hypothetical protein
MLAETLLVCATIFLASPQRRPLALAALGALASYYLQGRYWGYHFIAAVGLTMILLFWERRLALWTALGFVQVYQGAYLRPPSAPIPEGVTRVAVLSAHPSAAYPGAPGCRVRSIFPYGSLGFLPGPWNVATDAKRPESERQKAQAALMEERARLRRYIAQGNPQAIIADVRKRKTYFERPFDFVRFIGLPDGFHPVGRSGYFEIWARGPIKPNLCRERF